MGVIHSLRLRPYPLNRAKSHERTEFLADATTTTRWCVAASHHAGQSRGRNLRPLEYGQAHGRYGSIARPTAHHDSWKSHESAGHGFTSGSSAHAPANGIGPGHAV